jgi:hypothetical protein
MKQINPVVVILVIILTMQSAMLSVLLFTTNTYLQNTQIQQANSQKLGFHIVKQINDKLDTIHNISQLQLNAQGNISNAQRQKIINEFENLPDSGIASHADINNLIGNMTHQNANLKLQRDNNMVAHEILNILRNGTK